jgi:hypothetical protein
MRADAAPCAPFTARNALVMATLILAGSKPTTAPFLRITLYSEYGLRAAAAVVRQLGRGRATRRGVVLSDLHVPLLFRLTSLGAVPPRGAVL